MPIEHMRIITPETELICLPKSVLNQLKTAKDTELKVLLYLFARKEAETAEICSDLGIRPGDAEAAIAFWRGAGVFLDDERSPQKPVASPSSLFKSYDSETIHDKLESDPKFKTCCELVGEKLGKELTKNDYSSLVYLADYVGLPPEMIVGVAEYGVARGKHSMQYLMTTALKMYQEDGIDTNEKFEKHMAHLEELHSVFGRFRQMCGFGDRDLTTKETEYLTRWFDEWNLPFEVVRLGYEKTVDNTGKIKMPYMNTILKNWYENGWMTEESVKAGDKKDQMTGAAGYEDRSSFYEAALKKGYVEEEKTERKEQEEPV